jgi:type I restriction enzyme S subunit
MRTLDDSMKGRLTGEVVENKRGIQGPYDLPEGWKWVRLGDISIRKMGGTPRRNVPQYWGGNIIWATAKTITEEQRYVFDSEYKITEEGLKNSNAKLVPKGSVLLVTTGATAGKVAIAGVDLAINQQITAIIPTKEVYHIFLFYALKRVKSELLSLGGTTTFKHINQKKLTKLLIPLPPLEEQRRIVSRLEQLVNRAKEAKRLRKQAREEAEKIMQAALNKVFSRAEEKGWKWVKLKEIVYIRNETINPQDYPEEEFELYSIPAYHEKGKPEIKRGKEIKSMKVLVQPNDCLFGKLNPHLPKVWLVEQFKGKRQIASTEILPLIPKATNIILPAFIFWFLRTSYFRDRMVRKVIGTTGSRKRLSKGDVLEELIPLPPLEQQKKVVAYLDNVSKIVESLKDLQQKTEEKLEKLVPSILDKAFKGEL